MSLLTSQLMGKTELSSTVKNGTNSVSWVRNMDFSADPICVIVPIYDGLTIP